MQLYFISAMRRYVRTQGEAQKHGDFKMVDVPTDKDGLMGFLNNMLTEEDQRVADALPKIDEDAVLADIAQAKAALEAPTPVTFDRADRQINVEEMIHSAGPVELSAYASCVCWRMEQLTRELKNGRNVASGAEAPAGQPAAQSPDGEPLA